MTSILYRLGLALCNGIAWVYVGLVFWLSKHADPVICSWSQRTAGSDER